MMAVMKVKMLEFECICPRGKFLVDEFDIFFRSVTYHLMRFSGDSVSSLHDSDDDETIIVLVTIIVNSEELEGLFERREDSVIISVNSLLMMGFCSAIVSRQ